MTNDLRAAIEAAIAEALDLSPHSDTIDACSHRDPYEAYHMGFKDCREAVEAAIDAQAGMVMVPKEPVTGPRYEAGDWSRRNWEAALADQPALNLVRVKP